MLTEDVARLEIVKLEEWPARALSVLGVIAIITDVDPHVLQEPLVLVVVFDPHVAAFDVINHENGVLKVGLVMLELDDPELRAILVGKLRSIARAVARLISTSVDHRPYYSSIRSRVEMTEQVTRLVISAVSELVGPTDTIWLNCYC